MNDKSIRSVTNTPIQNLIEMVTGFNEKDIKMNNKSILLALVNSLEDESARIKNAYDQGYRDGFSNGFARAQEIALKSIKGEDRV